MAEEMAEQVPPEDMHAITVTWQVFGFVGPDFDLQEVYVSVLEDALPLLGVRGLLRAHDVHLPLPLRVGRLLLARRELLVPRRVHGGERLGLSAIYAQRA